ncbi:hypothetical protein MOC16_gp372 [Klebsiella phage vB_KpM_FBKp24]|uniref:Uncharacterized protein n=1 Tax=Klebsiella phage vB_KpM_FBKp24 TaxID=2801834 RepID=A0A7U0GBN6_9CAUD|nr:hypothetical protein MOC16_gp372 [Klebsiella phage vB_KpM_FBKp24]QQV92269.1 hypothetical protein vBKpMFBKp24_041 [Klebsiella phage vB_KpM_FBKp24]
MNDVTFAHNQEDVDHISSRLPLASDRSINDPAYLIKSKDVFAMISATKEFETIEKFENRRIIHHSQIYQSHWKNQFLSMITVAAKKNGWQQVNQYGGQILLVADIWLSVNGNPDVQIKN